MGNFETWLSDKTAEWDSKFGWKHYTDDTLITKQEWKTVPMTAEESKLVFRRMSTITGNVWVKGITGLKKSKNISTHDCIEVFHTSNLHTFYKPLSISKLFWIIKIWLNILKFNGQLVNINQF